jgi:hypothetical protein
MTDSRCRMLDTRYRMPVGLCGEAQRRRKRSGDLSASGGSRDSGDAIVHPIQIV